MCRIFGGNFALKMSIRSSLNCRISEVPLLEVYLYTRYMALQGAQYRNDLFPAKIRGCKRRFSQKDDQNESCLPAKIPVTEQEMSCRLYSLSLDQIDISHFLLYPHSNPTQQCTPPSNPQPAPTSTSPDPNGVTSDEETDPVVTYDLLTREQLQVAIDKSTKILPRDIIESIINTFPNSSCTAVALWKPIDRMLHLSELPTETNAEKTSTDVTDRSEEYFDEVMEIDS